jgi:RNA polymerase sigma factor (sigma-70 family)
MSALPLHLVRPARDLTDEELVDRIRADDPAAFAALHARYEARLVRYASRVLGGRRDLAEDVVQEALIRAHRALRRDTRPIALRAWLHRLVRNCALDELARARTDAVDLHALVEEPLAPGADPHDVAEQRRRTREVLGDLAALPPEQRHALLRREVDGLSHAQLARELGLTEAACRALVHRARRNVVKAAEARDDACEDVRLDLDRAADARRRASTRTYRHLASCKGCRAYRAELRRVGGAAQLLAPVPLLLGGVLGAKLLGLGSSKPLAGATATLAVAGGLGTTVLLPGDPAPVGASSAVVPGGALVAGEPLPRGTAVVTSDVHAPGTARLACPDGTVVAELLPAAPAAASHGFTAGTVPGVARTATVRVADGAAGTVTVRVLCKRLSAAGSLLAAPVPFAGPSDAARICRGRAYLRDGPRGAVVGSTFRGQPLERVGSAGGWTLVRADDGARGWVRSRRLC